MSFIFKKKYGQLTKHFADKCSRTTPNMCFFRNARDNKKKATQLASNFIRGAQREPTLVHRPIIQKIDVPEVSRLLFNCNKNLKKMNNRTYKNIYVYIHMKKKTHRRVCVTGGMCLWVCVWEKWNVVVREPPVLGSSFSHQYVIR